MSAQYQHLLECFEEWTHDSTPVLTGEAVVFDDVKLKKHVSYEKLIKEDPDWDPMTKQVLELIFGSFVVVTKRMLTDHLEGGKYDQPDVECKMNARMLLRQILFQNEISEWWIVFLHKSQMQQPWSLKAF